MNDDISSQQQPDGLLGQSAEDEALAAERFNAMLNQSNNYSENGNSHERNENFLSES